MKKYLLTIIVSLLVGFLLSNYMLNKYEGKVLPVFNEGTKVYLIQQGVYSSFESMQKNTNSLNEYIYSELDNMYYVYIAMTLDLDIAHKLQEYYKNNNIVTIVKNTTIYDSKFINYLENYDNILKQTNDYDTIKTIQKKILEQYKGE